MANTRRYRLELPAAPKTDDPKAIQKYLSDIRRLTMDEFNRLAGDFYSFREDVINSATIPLASVAAISVVASEYSAIFTWENPAQTQGLPTHVRVRIAEFGDTWAEYEYPLMTWTAHGLSPTTTYTFQIQLVRRAAASVSFVSALRNCPSVPVQVESTSEIRSRSFTTDGGLGPPTDDGTGGSVFPIPDVDGTPGPPGGANCWWEWQVQYVNLTTGEWMDTTYWGTVAGDAGEIDFDITVLDPLRVYRIKYREVCNGVPGAWNYGEPFTGGSDWLGNCGGNTISTSRGSAPFNTADLFVIPYACFVEGEGLFMREYLSGIQIVPGMGYGHVFKDTNFEWTIVTDTWDDTVTDDTRLVGSTYLPALTTLDNTSDFMVCIEIMISQLPTEPIDGFRTASILSIGDGRIEIFVIYSDAGVWGIRVEAVRENGGQFVLYETPQYNDGIEFGRILIFYVSDADGDKFLGIDGTVVATDTTGEEMRLDGMSGALQIRGFSGMFLSKIYGWSSALTAAEYTAYFGTPHSERFEYTGTIQYWTVPDNVTSVTIECAASQGRSEVFGYPGGGKGGIITGTFPVTPGQVYEVRVGGGFGVFGGGVGGNAGDDGGYGGDYSAVVRQGLSLDQCLVVAGGGGGNGAGVGGGGGYPNGFDGPNNNAYDGDGATQLAGGAGGIGTNGQGEDGSAFQGGDGGDGPAFDEGGGGGGGGWFGGGGAGSHSSGSHGGGGGSSHYHASATNVVVENDTNEGAGYIEFRWSGGG